MEIENRIRDQIESILVNDARNLSELKKMASADEPLETETLADERNLYHRIINSYRNTVNEVNALLEQNIASLSGFYRIVESIREKEDLQEICARIIDCLLQDFGADYGGILFPEEDRTLCVEGIREERKLLRIHGSDSLLGSREFEQELARIAAESGPDCVFIEDIYKETRFNSVDFPAVVRSVLCLPIILQNEPVGYIILSHSLPSFFNDNHVRILKILGALVAHLRFVHRDKNTPSASSPPASPDRADTESSEAYSVVLMSFDNRDDYGRQIPLERGPLREIRIRLRDALEGKESVLFYGERELVVLMPGVSSESLPSRVRSLDCVFRQWRSEKPVERRDTRLNLGFSACDGEEDLSRTLEMASLVMHPESDE